MNIKKEQIDDLNAVIEIELEPADYKPKVESVLADYRKKVKLDGFRPGKAPAGLLKKIYGKSILVEEVQKLLSEALNNFIKESDLKILGEPIPSEDSPKIDWDLQDVAYLFRFDIGISPSFELNLTRKDKVVKHMVKITDEMTGKQADSYRQRFGTFEMGEKAGEKDLLKIDITEVDESRQDVPDGVRTENSTLSLASIIDDKVRKQLIGIGTNEERFFRPEILFPNETDRAAAFRVKSEELETIDGKEFRITVKEVSCFKAAELNQELFDKAFGEGEINSEEEFFSKIRESISNQLENDSRFKLHIDTREKVLDKTPFDLPDNFLKRWMLISREDDKLTPEVLDRDYPAFSKDLKWQLIKNRIIADLDLKASDEELYREAFSTAYGQYRRYGIYDVPQEQLFRMADHLVKDENEKRHLVDNILETKVIEHLQTLVKIDEKEIALEDFQKLFS